MANGKRWLSPESATQSAMVRASGDGVSAPNWA
jgi:hypothetical protein